MKTFRELVEGRTLRFSYKSKQDINKVLADIKLLDTGYSGGSDYTFENGPKNFYIVIKDSQLEKEINDVHSDTKVKVEKSYV
jgi:hypothetical protein